MKEQLYIVNSLATEQLGLAIGTSLSGGEILELVGDVGSGKTTLIKGVAIGLGVKESVQSPSYTISSQYRASKERELHHYDFYRLNDPGIMAYELGESLGDTNVITAIEWSQTVEDLLPRDRVLRIEFRAHDTGREITLTGEKLLVHSILSAM